MPSSMTKIWDDIQKKYVDYDMGKGFDTIKIPEPTTTPASSPSTTEQLNEIYKPIAAAALIANTTDADYKPYSGMTPAEQASATAAALANNATVEASSLAWNNLRYPGETLTGPLAATIWNPDTGTKRTVRLDRKTGRVIEEDLLNLPPDLNLKTGGKWQLWTGGMASGIEARAAITNTPVPPANVPAPKPVVPAPTPVVTPAPVVKPAVVPPNMTTLWSPDGLSSKQVAIGSSEASTLQSQGWGLSKPIVASAPAFVNWSNPIYISDINALSKIPGAYTKKGPDGKLWLDGSKVQYIGTMAEVAKIPENKRVLLNGRYYKIL